MDEYNKASSATGWAVSALNCVLAEIWDGCTGSELGFLYAGDEDVVLGKEIAYLLTRVLDAICIELEKMAPDLGLYSEILKKGNKSLLWEKPVVKCIRIHKCPKLQ